MNQIDYTEWADTLKKYKADIDKGLAEMRAAKQELVDLQRQFQEMIISGRYERDEDTLILSAPHIIIGNVDKQGNLLSGGSIIEVRGNDIMLDGVGRGNTTGVVGGSIKARARNVSVTTVDPGIDGMENVAFPDSSFTVQTAAIGLSAEVVDQSSNGGIFTRQAQDIMGCINLAAETNINLSSAKSIENEKTDDVVKELEADSTTYGKRLDTCISTVGELTDELDKNMNNKLLDMIGAASEEADILALRMGEYKFDDRSEKTEQLVTDIVSSVAASAQNMSYLAESKRAAKYLKERATRLKGEKGNYEKEATGSSINIYSEVVDIATLGADGKIRTSPGNGVNITTQNTKISGLDESLKPIQGSTFEVVANYILADASDYTYEVKDDKLQLTKIEAKGKIQLNAKEVDMCGLDGTFEMEGDKLKPKYTLAKGSHLNTNFSTTLIDMSDEEGKAQGTFMLNAKDIMLNSYDVDKDKRVKPTGVSEGGKVTIGGKEVYVGTVVKDMKAETVQIAGKKVNVMGEEKVNLQQEKDKSHLLLDDNAELSGGDVKVIGKINLGGETKIDAKFTAGDIEAKNVKASSSVTGPNLKDGIPIPAPAAPVQPGKGAELKELEALEKVREDSGDTQK